MADEFARIEAIVRRLQQRSPHIVVDNGDDAAVLRLRDDLVISTDAAIDGTHFRLDWISFSALGYRAAVTALSDLAAMGATPVGMLSSLIAPTTLNDDDLYAIADGYAQAAVEYTAPVVGGNLGRGRELSLTTTVLGQVHGASLQRRGAQPGDVIYVTGTVGTAALGLHALQQDHHSSAAEPFVARWRKPVARVAEGEAVRTIATAALDVSDGLLQDLGHLCHAAGVGAVINVECLPLTPGSDGIAGALGVDCTDLALTGGEDYELLFTAPAGVTLPIAATAIGHINDTSTIALRDHGTERPTPSGAGFRHFG